MRAASPTLSGTPTTVILASLRSWATPAMIACSMESSFCASGTIQVPSFWLNDERTWIGHVVAAGVLDAAQVQDLRAAGGHLEHLLVEMRSSLRAVGTIRGSAVKTPSTSL